MSHHEYSTSIHVYLMSLICILFNSLDHCYAVPYAIIRFDFSAKNGYKAVRRPVELIPKLHSDK